MNAFVVYILKFNFFLPLGSNSIAKVNKKPYHQPWNPILKYKIKIKRNNKLSAFYFVNRNREEEGKKKIKNKMSNAIHTHTIFAALLLHHSQCTFSIQQSHLIYVNSRA